MVVRLSPHYDKSHYEINLTCIRITYLGSYACKIISFPLFFSPMLCHSGERFTGAGCHLTSCCRSTGKPKMLTCWQKPRAGRARRATNRTRYLRTTQTKGPSHLEHVEREREQDGCPTWTGFPEIPGDTKRCWCVCY